MYCLFTLVDDFHERSASHQRISAYRSSPTLPSTLPSFALQASQLLFSVPLTFDMSDESGPSRLQVLFEVALQDYEKQTGIALAKHPLAEQLQNCDSVESVTVVLREQTQAFSEFRGRDKVLKLLKNSVSVLHKLSATADLGQGFGLVRPQALSGSSTFLTIV